jgi:hypothetical protein
MKRRRATALAAIAAAASVLPRASAATPGFIEDFNGTITVFGGGSTRTIVSSGGAGGSSDGYLEIANAAPGHLGAHTTATEFTGDLTADGVTGFLFWLRDVGADDDLEIHVGIGVPTTNFWVNTQGFVPPDGSWQEFRVDITSSVGWVQTQGAGTFEAAKAASARLLFRHDVAPFEQLPDSVAGDFGIDQIVVLPSDIPAISEWGIAVLGLLVVLAGTITLRRRAAVAA